MNKLKVWFSGVFGVGAIVHAMRFIFKIPVVVNNYNIPMHISLYVAIGAGIISLILLGGCSCKNSKK